MAQRGGPREGSGRKSMRAEEDVKDAIKKALDSTGPETLDKIWQMVIQKAKEGSDKHINIFLNYYYGKPVDNVNVIGGMTVNFTRKVVKK